MKYKMTSYIGGQWIKPQKEEVMDLIDPATGTKFGEIFMSGEYEAKEAIRVANDAKQVWWELGHTMRKNIMYKLAKLIEENKDDFAEIESKNQGMPKAYVYDDIDFITENIKKTLELATHLTGSVYDLEPYVRSYNVVKPIGVCVVIAPWNFPLVVGLQGIIPALAAGNTVVFKPSEFTPLSAIKLFELIDNAGFPKGVVNLVVGDGYHVGSHLTESPLVDKITFTGSTKTGGSVLKASVNNFKSVNLELGGKNPFVVFEDADFDAAIANCVAAVTTNSGQLCVSSERLIVENSIKEKFVTSLAKAFSEIRLGRGSDSSTEIGPMVNKSHFDRVMEYISHGIKTNQKLVYGGKKAVFEDDELNGGYFIEPTIFVDIDTNSKLWKEEIFGPVAVVKGFDTLDEAVLLANDTDYGLSSGIFTEDRIKADYVADKIEAGIVWVNCYYAGSEGAHVMGWKNSGQAYQGGLRGLKAYTKEKLINIKK